MYTTKGNKHNKKCVMFEVLTAVTMKSAYSRMWRGTVRYKFTNVSKECTSSIFRDCFPPASCVYLLGLLVDPEDGGNTFLRNFVERLQDYTASIPKDSTLDNKNWWEVTSSFRSKTAYVVHEIDKNEKLLSCVIISGKRTWWGHRRCTSLNLWNTGSVLKLCPLTPSPRNNTCSVITYEGLLHGVRSKSSTPPARRTAGRTGVNSRACLKQSLLVQTGGALCHPWRRSQIATYRSVATKTTATAKRSNSERSKPMTYTQKRFDCKQKYAYFRAPHAAMNAFLQGASGDSHVVYMICCYQNLA
jgi:hypothetical protein